MSFGPTMQAVLFGVLVTALFAAEAIASDDGLASHRLQVAEADVYDDGESSNTNPGGKKNLPPIGPLRVCTDQGCGLAAERNLTTADLVGGLYRLLKGNERIAVKPCESSADARQCSEFGFNLFIMAGPLPAFANLEAVTFKELRLVDDGRRIDFSLGIEGTFLGAHANCGDFRANLTIGDNGNPIIKGTESFYCNWLVIGNIFWQYEHVFDYVDFVNGVIAGQYDFSAVGLLTVGGANGYGQHNLTPSKVALGPKSDDIQPPPSPTAASDAVPDAAAPKTDAEQQLASLKDLRRRGLIDENTYQIQQKAILEKMFGPVSKSPSEAIVRPSPAAEPADETAMQFGRYQALVIGNNNYRHLPKLRTAINDARTVAAVLEEDYGFRITLLLDAGRADIIEALDGLTETLVTTDNLLIYYAGHGWLDEDAGRGYWLATDAKPNRRTNWVSNATITDTLKTLQAKHVMVIADSCFSGTLTRGAHVGIRAGDYWRRMAEKWTRVALVSGGLEPVSDGTGDHSPFAKALISALRSNTAIMDGTQLFDRVRRPVMTAANQTPQYTDVRQAGHDGGDFLFVRKP